MNKYVKCIDNHVYFKGSWGNTYEPDLYVGKVYRVAPPLANDHSSMIYPVFGRLYPPTVATRVAHIWQQREQILHALDRLPQTFCHFDAHRGNLLIQEAPTGTHLIVIDWATAGAGPIGADAGMLMGVLTQRTLFTPHAYDALDTTIFTRYVAGLRSVGWQGDERLVRFGYLTTIALRIVIGYLPDDLHTWLDDSWYESVEAQTGSRLAILPIKSLFRSHGWLHVPRKHLRSCQRSSTTDQHLERWVSQTAI